MTLYMRDMAFMMMYVLPVYCAGRILVIRRKLFAEKKSFEMSLKTGAREVVMALFVLFMAGLLMLTFQNGQEWMRARNLTEAVLRFRNRVGVNLTPFHTIRNYIRYAPASDWLWVNIVGNIVMFIPWGFCLPLLWKEYRSFIKLALLSLMLPVCIEFFQLFVGRTVDVDDVILNFVGSMLGGVLFLIARVLVPKIGRLAK